MLRIVPFQRATTAVHPLAQFEVGVVNRGTNLLACVLAVLGTGILQGMLYSPPTVAQGVFALVMGCLFGLGDVVYE